MDHLNISHQSEEEATDPKETINFHHTAEHVRHVFVKGETFCVEELTQVTYIQMSERNHSMSRRNPMLTFKPGFGERARNMR